MRPGHEPPSAPTGDTSHVGTLLSINVARLRELSRQGRTVRTGIWKEPVHGRVRVDGCSVTGDVQADPRVHGGPDKAVYAYPSEHFALWSAELGRAFGPGSFGENLTTAGWVEAEVRVGDVWQWGDALLQVCQPRWPCFKLAMHTGRGDIGSRLKVTGRSGWYLRVLRPGTVPVAGPVRVVECDAAGVTVLDAVRAVHPGGDPAAAARVLAVAALAAEWREAVSRRA
jgi:MOSC domain-containing protein YiiM